MTNDQPPKEPHPDTRSSHAKAMDKVTQITSIAMCLAIPVLGGYYADQWLGTGYLFLFVGLFFGLAASGLQFRKLLISLERESRQFNEQHNSNK
jgi:F0F1-type ATP synthase assembly protein I